MPSELDCHVVWLRCRDSILLDSLDHASWRLFDGVDIVPEQFLGFVTRGLGDETMLLILNVDGDTAVGYAMAFDVAEHPFVPEWRRPGCVVFPDYEGSACSGRSWVLYPT